MTLLFPKGKNLRILYVRYELCSDELWKLKGMIDTPLQSNIEKG